MIIETFLENRDKYCTIRVPFHEFGESLESGIANQIIEVGKQTGHQCWALYQLTVEWDDMIIEVTLEKLSEEEINNRMYALQ